MRFRSEKTSMCSETNTHSPRDSDGSNSSDQAKVLIISHHLLLREGPQVGYLAEHLATSGAAVELLGPVSSLCVLKDVTIVRTPGGRLAYILLFVLGFIKGLIGRYSTVVAVDEIAAAAALLVSLLLPKTKVIIYFLDFFDDEPMTNAYSFSHWIIRRLAHRANLIVDCNESRIELRKTSLANQCHHAVVHNAPPLNTVMAQYVPNSAQSGIPSNVVRLLYSGTIRVEVFLEIVVDAITLYPDLPVCLLIAGNCESDYGNQLKQYCQKRLKPTQFRFLGMVAREQLASLYAAADIGLCLYGIRPPACSNEIYCAPNKVYEYMAAGLPVICSKNATLLDLVKRYGWGLCVDPENSHELAIAISRLVTDAELRASMSNLALNLHRDTMNFNYQVKSIDAVVFNK